MELAAPGLETSLVRLEPLAKRHRAALQASGAVEHMWSSMPLIATGTSLDAYFDHTLRMAELGTGLGLAAIHKGEDRMIGLAAYLSPNRLHRRIRLGYTWLEADYRGSGIINHIQFLMLKRALEWRARRVEWMMSSTSQRAIANVERLGALREGTLRQHSRFADGSWADLVVLSLVGEEIRAAMRELGQGIGEVETAAGA